MGGGYDDILKLIAIAKYKRGFASLEFPSFKFIVDLQENKQTGE